MQNLNNYISEKLILNKNIKAGLGHNAEYFPFDLIGTEDCYSLKIHGTDIWQSTPMIDFRRNLMAIFKKSKYKDILLSYTDKDDISYYMNMGEIYKDNGCINWRIIPSPEDAKDCIKKDGYTYIQKKISNANYLNSNLHPIFVSGVNRTIINIYMSWLDNYKCITINFKTI